MVVLYKEMPGEFLLVISMVWLHKAAFHMHDASNCNDTRKLVPFIIRSILECHSQ